MTPRRSARLGGSEIHLAAQLAAIAFALIVFAVVFEMVRRRYLRERYAILWLAAALVLLILAAWTQLLESISHAVGIATPSNAFFVIAFAFLLLLLLHFSSVVSRLADETRVLAQRIALLEQDRRTEGSVGDGEEAGYDFEAGGAASPSSRQPQAHAGLKH
ncbi:MAG: DUF2304 domain-containing protein [Solirubrobacteraceae bacterium]